MATPITAAVVLAGGGKGHGGKGRKGGGGYGHNNNNNNSSGSGSFGKGGSFGGACGGKKFLEKSLSELPELDRDWLCLRRKQFLEIVTNFWRTQFLEFELPELDRGIGVTLPSK